MRISHRYIDPATCKQFSINVDWTVLSAARALRQTTSDDAVICWFGDVLQGIPARVLL